MGTSGKVWIVLADISGEGTFVSGVFSSEIEALSQQGIYAARDAEVLGVAYLIEEWHIRDKADKS